jgi:hypothetical protein
MTIFPFEAAYQDILQDPERYVDAVFSCLESEFLIMPKGAGFVEYPVFEKAYEALKAATTGFSQFDPRVISSIAVKEPFTIVILRTMLGFTPPEWGVYNQSKNRCICPVDVLGLTDRSIHCVE